MGERGMNIVPPLPLRCADSGSDPSGKDAYRKEGYVTAEQIIDPVASSLADYGTFVAYLCAVRRKEESGRRSLSYLAYLYRPGADTTLFFKQGGYSYVEGALADAVSTQIAIDQMCKRPVCVTPIITDLIKAAQGAGEVSNV